MIQSRCFVYALACAAVMLLPACSLRGNAGLSVTANIGGAESRVVHYDLTTSKDISFESGPYQVNVNPDSMTARRIGVTVDIVEMATGQTPLKGAKLSIKRGCWATVTLQAPKAPEMHLAIAYTG